MMNKHDLLDHIKHVVDVDETKIRKLYDRKFTVTAYREDEVIGLGEFDDIHEMNFNKDRLWISNTENITIAPGETVERITSAELDINFNYTIRMLDTDETIEMRDLIIEKNKYVFKTDVIELGDFIRFKRIYSQDKYYSGTAIVTEVETYRLGIMAFNNERCQRVDIWAHELYKDGQDFEFEIIAKHEYVEHHNDCVVDKSVDISDEVENVEAVDVLDETE